MVLTRSSYFGWNIFNFQICCWFWCPPVHQGRACVWLLPGGCCSMFCLWTSRHCCSVFCLWTSQQGPASSVGSCSQPQCQHSIACTASVLHSLSPSPPSQISSSGFQTGPRWPACEWRHLQRVSRAEILNISIRQRVEQKLHFLMMFPERFLLFSWIVPSLRILGNSSALVFSWYRWCFLVYQVERVSLD